MSQDPVEAYKQAREELDEAFTKVVRIRRIITEASEMMQHPYDFIVSGTDVVFPSEVGLVRTPTLAAYDWPNARQIAQSLVTLHGKYRIAQNAWANLSQSDRANVQKLPDRI
jgi:hypothetical protein